jgi:hypothetical protein
VPRAIHRPPIWGPFPLGEERGSGDYRPRADCGDQTHQRPQCETCHFARLLLGINSVADAYQRNVNSRSAMKRSRQLLKGVSE